MGTVAVLCWPRCVVWCESDLDSIIVTDTATDILIKETKFYFKKTSTVAAERHLTRLRHTR